MSFIKRSQLDLDSVIDKKVTKVTIRSSVVHKKSQRSQLDLDSVVHKRSQLDLDMVSFIKRSQLDLDIVSFIKRSQLDLDSVIHKKVTIRSR